MIVFSTIVFAMIAAVGVALTSAQVILTIAFRRHGRFFGRGPRGRAGGSASPRGASRPFVSILKPVSGLEDELRGNLESFAALADVDYEVIFSVADPDDPALEVIRDVMTAHPAAPFRLVTGGDPRLERGNRKVARLVAAEPAARGDILFISDANARVEANAIAETIAAFTGTVGCVSNLFTGSGASTFGATIESLHILGFVGPGSVLAAFGGVPCVVGKSMAISLNALRAIGGFARFADVLAEDQAIGLAVRKAGYDVVLSPVTVRNVIVRRTLRRALDRQIRWNKIRYAFSKLTYTAEFLLNPLPFAIALSAIAAAAQWSLAPFLIAAIVAVIRVVQLALLAAATGASLRASQIAAAPLQDLLQFGAQFFPYFDDRVTWRGHVARIGPSTRLLPVVEKAA
ncbi:MAG: glycosyltransferase [Thermoanaerobaculia bacterium]